ncbi:ankyrin repeat-containing domain protein [Aspergillus granulosus]|uniref:Ankyrin repeat-containing domain protein n=1 Tax=Aspergillus granulosus TaxID=176169 RepID=A0ABR4GSJ8_9EURO
MTHPPAVALPDLSAQPGCIPSSGDLTAFSNSSDFGDHWTLRDETPASSTSPSPSLPSTAPTTPASSTSPSPTLPSTAPPTPPASSLSDDGYDTGSDSSTESIVCLPYRIIEKYSRVYPEIDGYPWPIDATAVDGREFLSRAIYNLLGQLIYGPVDKPGVILDIGTGTGYWAREAAYAYPCAKVCGVDRALIQHPWVPANCDLFLDVMDREAWHPVRSCKEANVVRVAGICGDGRLLLSILEDAYNYCASGTVVQIHDITVRLDDPHGKTSFHQFYRDLEKAYQKDDRTWNLADSYEEMFRRIGYQRVTRVVREISLCDRHNQEEENVYKEWKASLAPHATYLFCERLGKDATQAIVEFAAARNALDVGIRGKLAIEIVYGVKPNAESFVNLTNDRYTALHHAAANGNASTVRELLEQELNINVRDCDGQTPLHLAARNGHQEVVKVLLSQQHINLNAWEPSHYTPLMCAVMSGATEVAGLLLDTKGVEVDTTSYTQRHLLQLAIEGGHIGTIRRLLQDPRLDVSSNWGYNSPLLASIRAGRDPVTLFVLSQGGLNDVRTPLGESALLLAIRKGSPAVVKEILKDDTVDVNSTDHNGWNALRCAASGGNMKIVRILLVDRRTDVKSVDLIAAVKIAMARRHFKIAVVLKRHFLKTTRRVYSKRRGRLYTKYRKTRGLITARPGGVARR